MPNNSSDSIHYGEGPGPAAEWEELSEEEMAALAEEAAKAREW